MSIKTGSKNVCLCVCVNFYLTLIGDIQTFNKVIIRHYNVVVIRLFLSLLMSHIRQQCELPLCRHILNAVRIRLHNQAWVRTYWL